jgi:hypothetical protein
MLVKNDRPELSVIVVVGERRDRAQRMLKALASQSAADLLEVIIVDAAAHGAPVLMVPPGLSVKCVRAEEGIMPGIARFEGTKIAAAPVVAYLEDHCVPEEDWARAIIESHRRKWDAVGYTFLNGSPDTYVYRAIFLAEYGPWAHPNAGGPTSRLPGSNVSYKKKELEQFGDRLAGLLEMDYILHESLRNRGLKFYIESKALVGHESYASFGELLYCHFLFSRLQAARRARIFSWSFMHRLILGLAAPLALPMLQLFRAWRVFRTHELRSAWLSAIPVIYLIHLCESFGECLGFLSGPGNSGRLFALRELNGARIVR